MQRIFACWCPSSNTDRKRGDKLILNGQQCLTNLRNDINPFSPSVTISRSKSILLQALYLVVLNYANKLLSYVWYSCSSMSDEPLVWDVHWRDSAVLTFTHLLLGPQKTSPFQNSVLKASTDQQNWEPKRFIVSKHQRQECPSSRDAKAKSIKMHRELNNNKRRKKNTNTISLLKSSELLNCDERPKLQATQLHQHIGSKRLLQFCPPSKKTRPSWKTLGNLGNN